MNTVHHVRHQLDQRDIVIVMLVERLREQAVSATPAEVARNITGATTARVVPVMERLNRLQVLDRLPMSYVVSPLGAEIMSLEIEGWKPSPDEQRRRDRSLRSAAVGALKR